MWQVAIGSVVAMADPTTYANGDEEESAPRDWYLEVTEIFLDQNASPAWAGAACMLPGMLLGS